VLEYPVSRCHSFLDHGRKTRISSISADRLSRAELPVIESNELCIWSCGYTLLTSLIPPPAASNRSQRGKGAPISNSSAFGLSCMGRFPIIVLRHMLIPQRPRRKWVRPPRLENGGI
jgi:hypothetical protein